MTKKIDERIRRERQGKETPALEDGKLRKSYAKLLLEGQLVHLYSQGLPRQDELPGNDDD